MNLSFLEQPKPEGLGQAFILGEDFVGNDNVCLILGDNIFYGYGFGEILKEVACDPKGATVFGYYVNDPERYGVVDFDENGNALGLEEKPTKPKSNYAVTGLYFYDNSVIEFSKKLKPSPRGELEITDVNRCYLEQGTLDVAMLGRGYCWFDAGTHDSLLRANQFIQTVELRQGYQIACLEEIAYLNGWVDHNQLLKIMDSVEEPNYREYLCQLMETPSEKLCVPS